MSRSFKLEYNYVFVFQSLKKGDRETGKELYDDIIKRRCDFNSVKSELYTPATKQEFFAIFKDIIQHSGIDSLMPLFHFEIHGNKTGMELTNGDRISWEELGELCRLINIKIRNQLIISLATCWGAYFLNAIDVEKPSPFWGYVGPRKRIESGVLLEDYTEFYNIFLKSGDLVEALKALELRHIEYEYLFLNAEMFFDDVKETLLRRPKDDIRRFHELKSIASDVTPIMNRSQRRNTLKKIIKENDKRHIMQEVKNKFLIRNH